MLTLSDKNPVSAINADIDSLMARLPRLPAWAAHQLCGWGWQSRGKRGPTAEEAEREERRMESEYSHSEGAHQ